MDSRACELVKIERRLQQRGLLLAVLAMRAVPCFPYPKLAAVVASLVFLVAVFLLALVVVSAVLPFEDLRMFVPAV